MTTEPRDPSEILEDLQSDVQKSVRKMNEQAAATEAAKAKQTATRGQKVFGGIFTVFMGLVLMALGIGVTFPSLGILPDQVFDVGANPPSFWLALLVPCGALCVWLGFVILFPKKKSSVPNGMSA